MKKVLLIISLFVLCLNMLAGTTDSLISVLPLQKEDTARVQLLNQISLGYRKMNKPDSALLYAQRARESAFKCRYPEGYARALMGLGQTFDLKGNFDEAIKVYQFALDLAYAVQLDELIQKTASYLGSVYKKKGDLAKALKYGLVSIEVCKRMNHLPGLASGYNNMGEVYRHQKKYNEALQFYLMAEKMNEKTGNINWLSINYLNIGIVYSNFGNEEKSVEYFEKAIGLSQKTGNMMVYATTLLNLGAAYRYAGKYDESEKCYKEVDQIFSEVGDISSLALINVNRGNLRMETGKNNDAAEFFERGLTFARKAGQKTTIREAYSGMAQNDSARGKMDKAFEHYKLFVAYRDSIYGEESTEKAIEAAIQHEYEKKASADSVRIAEEKLVVAAERKNERTQRTALYGGLALVLVFSGFIYNRFRVTQKQNQIIESQKRQVEEKATELEAKNKEITDSINYAKRLQEAILPPLKVVKEYLSDSFILYKPKDIVAGDFYWMEPRGDMVLFAAADCTGHGVPGAMVSVVCSNALNRAVKEFGITDPGKLLDKVRALVIETFEKSESDVKDGMDISLCSYSVGTRRLYWSGANNPLWLIQQGKFKEIVADKQPIGKFSAEKPFTTHEIQLDKGDSFYLFTDGYADQFGGPKGKKFKYRPLQELLMATSQIPMEHQRERLNVTIEDWMKGYEQVDDICIIGVRV